MAAASCTPHREGQFLSKNKASPSAATAPAEGLCLSARLCSGSFPSWMHGEVRPVLGALPGEGR